MLFAKSSNKKSEQNQCVIIILRHLKHKLKTQIVAN